jgi:uncharacterized SAM-binding protein YcdF (DUF218 family)
MRRVLRWVLVLALPVYLLVTFAQVWSATRWDDRSRTDAIIVLGAAQYNGKPSPVLRARLDHALELYRAGVAPRVVVTGSKKTGDRFTEAYAGYQYLKGKGVPEKDLVVVSTGTSTWESLAASNRVLKAKGIARVTLVSDPYHSFRLAGIADEAGLDGVVSPTGAAVGAGRLLRETAIVSVGRIIGYRRVVNWFE